MLTIRSAEADRLAREIADATGTSLTEAVTVALRERRARLDAEEAARREAYIARAMELQREFLAALGPNKPTLEEIDADMYDEHGLPR